MIQAIATGYVASHEEARKIIRRSFEVERYEPTDGDDWEVAYERFMNVLGISAELKL
jgi:hypothetical protein